MLLSAVFVISDGLAGHRDKVFKLLGFGTGGDPARLEGLGHLGEFRLRHVRWRKRYVLSNVHIINMNKFFWKFKKND